MVGNERRNSLYSALTFLNVSASGPWIYSIPILISAKTAFIRTAAFRSLSFFFNGSTAASDCTSDSERAASARTSTYRSSSAFMSAAETSSPWNSPRNRAAPARATMVSFTPPIRLMSRGIALGSR